jgi:hypothetical protein
MRTAQHLLLSRVLDLQGRYDTVTNTTNSIHLIEASRKRASEPTQANVNFGAFQALWLSGSSMGTPQHTALVSDLRSAFPEIYAPAEDARIAD